MDLNKLNNASFVVKKEVRKLYDLNKDQPYPILRAKIVSSKFGKVILIEIQEANIFLPNRVTEAYEKNLDHFIDGKYSIVFRGRVDIGKQSPLTSFEIVEN